MSDVASQGDLLARLKRKDFTAAVIGLGYVGLPLAVECADAGIRVIGIDSDGAKIRAIRSGKSYVDDVPSETVKAAVDAGFFRVTSDYSALAEADTVNICVPTPLRKTKTYPTS
jgi:UDP-N-acetyl-D-glucosamine dehydrogenase